MEQLKLGDILNLAKELKLNGMKDKDIKELPVYLGCDDELNGIHTAWYGQLISSDNENDNSFIDMINEDRCNIKFNNKAILIS